MFRTLPRVSIELPVLQVGSHLVPTLGGRQVSEVYLGTTGDAYLALDFTNSSYLFFEPHRSGVTATRSVLTRRTLRELNPLNSAELVRIAGEGSCDGLTVLAWRVLDAEKPAGVEAEDDDDDLGRPEDEAYVRACSNLKRGCAAFVRMVSDDEALLRDFHRRTHFKDWRGEPWGFVFGAIADVAREGVESDAYRILTTLSSFNNKYAVQALYNLIQSGGVEGIDHTDMGVARAMAMATAMDDAHLSRAADRAGRAAWAVIQAVRAVHPWTPRRYMVMMTENPEALTQIVSEYVDDGRGDELSQIVHDMIERGDREDLDAGLRTLADRARSGDAGALYLLRCFYWADYPGSAALLKEVGTDSFISMFMRFKGNGIPRKAPSTPHELYALRLIEVSPDETDRDCLKRLAYHGNTSAQKRLKELRESADGEVVPLRPK